MSRPKNTCASDCPICGTPMKLDDSYMDHTLMEYSEVCPRECYSHEFVTGSYRIYIGTKEWFRNHADSPEESDRLTKEMTDELDFAKRHPRWWRFKFRAHVAWLRTWGRIQLAWYRRFPKK